MVNAFMEKFLPMLLLSVVSMLTGFLVVLWFQKGFLITFLKVKASRGKDLLVWVITSMGKRACHGKTKGETVRYKYAGEFHTVDISLNKVKAIYSALGVFNIDVPLGSVKPLKFGTYEKPALDSNITDNLVNRAYTRPQIQLDKKDVIVMVIVFIILLAVLVLFWQNGQVLKAVQQLVGSAGSRVIQ